MSPSGALRDKALHIHIHISTHLAAKYIYSYRPIDFGSICPLEHLQILAVLELGVLLAQDPGEHLAGLHAGQHHAAAFVPMRRRIGVPWSLKWAKILDKSHLLYSMYSPKGTNASLGWAGIYGLYLHLALYSTAFLWPCSFVVIPFWGAN